MYHCIQTEDKKNVLDLDTIFNLESTFAGLTELYKETNTYINLPNTTQFDKLRAFISYLTTIAAKPDDILFPTVPQVSISAIQPKDQIKAIEYFVNAYRS